MQNSSYAAVGRCREVIIDGQKRYGDGKTGWRFATLKQRPRRRCKGTVYCDGLCRRHWEQRKARAKA